MKNRPKKYKNASSFSQVSSLAGFIKWVAKINEKNMLFRGLANASWGGESSLGRKLKDKSGNIDSNIFLEETKALIKKARKKNEKLNDLELLADLQHKKIDPKHEGEDTCLIDFTRLSFVALYFACASVDNREDNKANSKVVAFSSDNTDLYNKITQDTKKEIGYLLTEYETNQKLWIFSPPPEVNDEITPQQSVFVFGSPTISIDNFHICEIKNKAKIIEELKKNGVPLTTDSPLESSTPVHKDKGGPNSDGNKAINPDTQDSVTYYNRGNTKIKFGKFQDAIRDYDEAIRLNPDYQAYCNRGNAKKDLGKFQDAILDYDKAIKLNHEDWVTYNNRGNAKKDLGKFQDAIRDFDKAIKLNPEDWTAYNNRGLAKNKLSNLEDAIRDFDEAIRLNPTSSTAYNNRGNSKFKLKKYQDAIHDYNKAIKLNKKYYKAYYNRGIAKNRSGDITGAASDYAKATEIELKIKDLSSENPNK